MFKFLVYFSLLNISYISAQATIDAVLESYKKDNDLKHALYSYCVIEINTGKIIKEYNAEMAMIPASTLKIVTTAAALGILGKDFTYKTKYNILYNNGSVEKATETQLFIEGSGDPTFNSAYFYNNDSLFFLPLISKLKFQNVKNILSTTISSNCFDTNIPSTWIWGDIGNYYGADASGLSYKDNKFSLFYSSFETNSQAKLQSIKPTYFANKISITSNVIAKGTEDEAYVYGDPQSNIRTVEGTIPPNKTNYEIEAQMPHVNEFFEYELKKQLTKYSLCPINTISPTKITERDTIFKSQLIYTHTSPKLSNIVLYTNTKSNNHYAESLLKTLGTQKYSKQGTTANGIDVVKKYWKGKGIDVSGLNMVDGSGLSRANTITTKIQASILYQIFKDSVIYNAFNNSLPVAGKNGSMVNLCKGTFAENNMRAKTGYINRARGYCGYLKTKSGKELAFSVLFNNYDCSPKEMKLKIEKLLISLTDLN